MTSARATLMIGALSLFVLSGLTLALPFAHANSGVAVSIPNGAGLASGAPGYSPDTITVVIGVNNTVAWYNNDTANHTVSPQNVPAGAGWGVGSGNMLPGQVYSFTFTVPGTYTYTCAYHSWMTGTVVVVGASTSPAPEFPSAYLAIILFAAIGAALVAAPRLKPTLAPQASR